MTQVAAEGPIFLGIIIPAFNEDMRLLPTLTRLAEYYGSQAYTWAVWVVDDGSLDQTGHLVEEFAANHPCFKLISYSPNRGKGFAVRKGMLEVEAEMLLFCDADLATPQEETEKLLKSINSGFDLAIGSRPLKQSHLDIRQPWYRELLGRSFNGLVQVLAVKGIHDTQCGFKLFTKSAARDVFSRCEIDRYSFDIEALMIARDLNLKIDEVPIHWAHQEGSKVSIVRDGAKMIRDLIMLRVRGKRRRLAVKSP